MIKNFLTAALMTTFGAYCQRVVTPDFAILSGTIKNKINKNIIVFNSDYMPIDTIVISPKGQFLDTLRVTRGFYIISYDKVSTKVYLEAGLNLNVAFDVKNFKNSLKFSGQGEPINSYFQKKASKQWGLIEDLKKRYGLSESDFKGMVGKAKASKDSLLISQIGISESFKNKEKKNINYEYINELLKYESDRAYYTGKPDTTVSKDFLPDLNGFNYEDYEDFSYSNSYKSIVSAHYRKLGEELAKKENSENYSLTYITAVSGANNQDIKNILLYEHAKNAISYASDLEAYYKIYIHSSTDQSNNKVINEIYQKLLPLAKGSSSPKFVGYDSAEGSKVSLDDLKGKYVYIDVWATWCGPCKVEIPHLSKLEKEYEGRNIQFLSISIDKRSDIGKWKKMITDKKMGGIQLIADNAGESKFVQDYYIMGIPRFILLDPQGNIVSSNAPRPSEEKLKVLLNGLNI